MYGKCMDKFKWCQKKCLKISAKSYSDVNILKVLKKLQHFTEIPNCIVYYVTSYEI